MGRRHQKITGIEWMNEWYSKWPEGELFDWARAERCRCILEELFEYKDQLAVNFATLNDFLEGLLNATKAIDKRKTAANKGMEIKLIEGREPL